MDSAAVVRKYQQALGKQPNSPELHYHLAIALHQMGDWEAARNSYQEAIALKLDYAEAYYHLGLLCDQRGEAETATENYLYAINYQPDYIDAYNNLGCLFVKQGKFEKAREVFEGGLSINPNSAILQNNLAQVLSSEKKLAQAIASYQRTIQLDSKMALAHHNLGKLWLGQRNYPEAVICFQQVIALEPNNIQAYGDCATSLMAQGKFALAMKYFRGAIALQPVFVEAFCQKAKLFQEDDLLSYAKVACAKFLEGLQGNLSWEEVSTHLWHTHFYLGDVLFQYGSFPQAEIHYQKALQIQPDEVELYLRLGNCLVKQNRLEVAILIYHLGLNIQPDHPEILLHLATVLEKQQRLTQAIEYYEQLLELDLAQPIEISQISHTELPKLPKYIYRCTREWLKDTFDYSRDQQPGYVEVIWGEKLVGEEEKSFENILTPPSGYRKPQFECGGVTCKKCMTQLVNLFQPIQLGKGAYFCSRQETLPINTSKTFVASIPQARAWIAPQQNAWLICDAIAIITPDDYLLADLSRFYPWFLPGCQNHDLANHAIFSLEKIPPVEKIKGTVAILSSLSGHVYYHWLIDVIPRIGILQRGGFQLEEIDWFVVNSIKQPFQRETLPALGIPLNKIIESDLHSHIQAENLIIPSFAGHLDWVSQGTMEFLREAFLSKNILSLSGYPERIYISRKKAKYRQIINEQEVVELLNKLDFTTVFAEELSFVEQVALFAKAKIIITSHGSALTNLVFCQPGTQIIELFSPNYLRTDYWMISHQLGLKHYYLTGEQFECYPIQRLMHQNPLTEDILLDLNSLKLLLAQLEEVK